MKHKIIRVSDLRESYRELGDKLFALYVGGRVTLKTTTHRVVVESSPTAILDVVLQGTATQKDLPVLFKSCGWAGWDLAAARLAMRVAATV